MAVQAPHSSALEQNLVPACPAASPPPLAPRSPPLFNTARMVSPCSRLCLRAVPAHHLLLTAVQCTELQILVGLAVLSGLRTQHKDLMSGSYSLESPASQAA